MNQAKPKGGGFQRVGSRHLGKGRKKKHKRPKQNKNDATQRISTGKKKLSLLQKLQLQKLRFQMLRYTIQKEFWRYYKKYVPLTVLVFIFLLLIGACVWAISAGLHKEIVVFILQHVFFKLIFGGKA
jgi:hypothetical protein